MLLGPWLISIWAHLKVIEGLLGIKLSWVCMIHMLVSYIWCWWMHLVPRVSLELPMFLVWGHPRSQSIFGGSQSRLRCSSCCFWKCWKWEVVVWNQNPKITLEFQIPYLKNFSDNLREYPFRNAKIAEVKGYVLKGRPLNEIYLPVVRYKCLPYVIGRLWQLLKSLQCTTHDLGIARV